MLRVKGFRVYLDFLPHLQHLHIPPAINYFFSLILQRLSRCHPQLYAAKILHIQQLLFLSKVVLLVQIKLNSRFFIFLKLHIVLNSASSVLDLEEKPVSSSESLFAFSNDASQSNEGNLFHLQTSWMRDEVVHLVVMCRS